MQNIAQLKEQIAQFKHPAFIINQTEPQTWLENPKWLRFDEATKTLEFTFPFYHQTLINELQAWWQNLSVKSLSTKRSSTERSSNEWTLDIKVKVASMQPAKASPLKGVKNIIAVSSGKGGVGKSMIAFNLALAMRKQGAKVGILDADIYGPSLPLMSQTQDAMPQIIDNQWMKPVEAFGLFINSIGYLVDKNDATIWRGPMASKALTQLINETLWPDLDYLIVDMPPGTGDIQLTLAQQIPVTASIVVTTPQDLALADATKGVAMFEKVAVPVLGVVENMSYHQCEQCGHVAHLFGQDGASTLAKQHALALLAQVPLHMDYRQNPNALFAKANDPHAQVFLQLAEQVMANLYWQGIELMETISVIDLS